MEHNDEFVNIPTSNIENMKECEEDMLLNDKNDKIEEKLQKIYQIVTHKNNKTVQILHVGDFTDVPSVLIQEFELISNVKCQILSKFYTIDDIKKNNDICNFVFVMQRRECQNHLYR